MVFFDVAEATVQSLPAAPLRSRRGRERERERTRTREQGGRRHLHASTLATQVDHVVIG